MCLHGRTYRGVHGPVEVIGIHLLLTRSGIERHACHGRSVDASRLRIRAQLAQELQGHVSAEGEAGQIELLVRESLA
jgi:hypothetical protein